MTSREMRDELQRLCSPEDNHVEASAESERRLSSSLKRIVRRVLRTERATSALGHYILSDARKVETFVRGTSDLDPDDLVKLVSRRIGETVMGRRLQTQSTCAFDVNRTVGHQHMETVMLAR